MDITIPQILDNLIKIPSISGDPQTAKEIVDYVANLFITTSYRVHIYEDAGVYSIAISKRSDLHFEILFLGHLDVVHGNADQFKPFIADGAMHGRGAADMKGGCAAIIKLFLENENNPLFDNLGLVFTTDEEIGGFHGTAYLIKEHDLQARVAYTPDGPNTTAFEPCIKEKGMIGIYLRTKGDAVHSSTPWRGDNAIDKLLIDIEAVKHLYPYATEENQWTISCSLTKISAGDAINKVPDAAEAFFDIRYTPDFSKEAIIANIKSNLIHAQMEIFVTIDPVTTDEHDPIVQKFIAATQSFMPHHVVPIFTNGASDLRWFVPQKSITFIMSSKTSLFHVQDEWADLQALETLKDILFSFIQSYYS